MPAGEALTGQQWRWSEPPRVTTMSLLADSGYVVSTVGPDREQTHPVARGRRAAVGTGRLHPIPFFDLFRITDFPEITVKISDKNPDF